MQIKHPNAIQGCSLTMGQENPSPPVFDSGKGKSIVRPLHFLNLKRPKPISKAYGPSTFTNVTTPLQLIDVNFSIDCKPNIIYNSRIVTKVT